MLEIRRARAEDAEDVLSFCRQTFDWGDYIDEVWSGWLADETGELLVATVDGHAAGILHLALAPEGQAFLEGLRVNPLYRRTGIGRTLTEVALAKARDKGASTARLLIALANRPSMSLARQLGFRQIASYRVFTRRAAQSDAVDNIRPGRPEDAPLLLELARAVAPSARFPEVAAFWGWTWAELTADVLARACRDGIIQVAVKRPSSAGDKGGAASSSGELIQAWAATRAEGTELAISSMYAMTEHAAGELLSACCDIARRQGLETVSVFVPSWSSPQVNLIAVLWQKGFRQEENWGEFALFERRLFDEPVTPA